MDSKIIDLWPLLKNNDLAKISEIINETAAAHNIELSIYEPIIKVEIFN